jgi:hypothetical protein
VFISPHGTFGNGILVVSLGIGKISKSLVEFVLKGSILGVF